MSPKFLAARHACVTLRFQLRNDAFDARLLGDAPTEDEKAYRIPASNAMAPWRTASNAPGVGAMRARPPCVRPAIVLTTRTTAPPEGVTLDWNPTGRRDAFRGSCATQRCVNATQCCFGSGGQTTCQSVRTGRRGRTQTLPPRGGRGATSMVDPDQLEAASIDRDRKAIRFHIRVARASGGRHVAGEVLDAPHGDAAVGIDVGAE